MSDEQSNSDKQEPLEGLLRDWGADEAARSAETHPPPVVVMQSAPPEKQKGPTWIRWVPMMAAGLLLIASGVLVLFVRVRPLASGGRAAHGPAVFATEQLKRAPPDVDRELHQVREDLAGVRKAHQETEKLATKLTKDLARTRDDLRTSELALKQSLDEHDKFKSLADERSGELAQVLDDLKAARSQFGEVRREHERALNDLQRTKERLLALGEEMATLRTTNDEALAGNRKMQVELAALKARSTVATMAMQRAYLAVPSDVQIDLPVRQAAAERADLIGRYAKLRPGTPEGPTTELLDKLEAVLTRLVLLDPYDTGAVETFADMIEAASILQQIDRAMSRGLAMPDVRTWLFETKLILSGVSNVG